MPQIRSVVSYYNRSRDFKLYCDHAVVSLYPDNKKRKPKTPVDYLLGESGMVYVYITTTSHYSGRSSDALLFEVI